MDTAIRNRVFVGVDGSITSMEALRVAKLEADRHDAELHMVYVRPPNSRFITEVGYLAETSRPTEYLDARAAEYLTNWIEQALGRLPQLGSVHRHVLVGKPGRELVNIANRHDDLLVVGENLRSPLYRMFKGSTSQYCSRHAVCRVLVVPADHTHDQARTAESGTR